MFILIYPFLPYKKNHSSILIKQTSSNTYQPQSSKYPPYPERFNLVKPIIFSKFDLITRLKNVCIKIPFIQAIKDIPIYVKTVRELCIKKLGRKKIEPQTIQFIGKTTNLMSGHICMDNYIDPNSPIVSVHITNILISESLIFLGVVINIMNTDTMEQFHLSNLQPTPRVLELADRSKLRLWRCVGWYHCFSRFMGVYFWFYGVTT